MITKTQKQSGFTIIELAVVMIVIGLVIGGILKTQHILSTTQTFKLAEQHSSIKAAFYNFIDRYQNLPGDMRCVDAEVIIGDEVDEDGCSSTIAIGGNGDGAITSVKEASALWAHLSSAGYLNETFTGDIDTADQYTTSAVAAGKLPGNSFHQPFLLAHMNNYVETDSKATISRLAFSFGSNIPVPLLRDLDQMLDDGMPGTGVLRSASWNTISTGGFEDIVEYDINGDDDCLLFSYSSSTWMLDSNNQTCNAVFLY